MEQLLILLPILLVSIVLHEVAHAWVARREGDDTAERLGRITLNPMPHLDPVGSFVVPALLAASGGGVIFGWAKPVPVDRAKIRTGAMGDIRVSLAGIVVNLLLAIAFALVMAIVVHVPGLSEAGPSDVVLSIAYFGVRINLLLAVFNLIPIPPLDGSHVVYHMLPPALRGSYQALGSVGLLIFIALFFLVPGGFAMIMRPVNFMTDVLFGLFGLSGFA